MNCRNVSNQKGQATTLALVAIGATTIAVLFMMDRIVNVERDLRYPRIKAQQTIQKVRLMTALNLPMMYTNCTVTEANVASNMTNTPIQNCKLEDSTLQSFLSSVRGADCIGGYTSVTGEIVPASGGCGFSLRRVSAGTPIWDSPSRKFRADLHYMGKESTIADTRIEFNVPGQLLTGEITICPADKPQFQGFDNSGAAICVAFETSVCPKGQFMAAVDPVTFKPTCHDYTSTPSCGQNGFFTSLNFSNGKYTGGCQERMNPFIYYDYNPEKSVSSQEFSGPIINAWTPGDYSWYNVYFDSPIIAPPPSKACDATSGAW